MNRSRQSPPWWVPLVPVVALAAAMLHCTINVPPGSLSADIPDVVSDTAVQDGDAPIEPLPDVGEPTACGGDLDCAHIQGCCYVGVCASGTCVARALTDCCSVPGPCAVSTPLHAATCAETCVAGGCEKTLRLPDADCGAPELWDLDLTTDPLSQVTVADSDPDDRVAWHPTLRRGLGGGPSLHAGDVVCPTYYSGPLDAACRPLDPAAEADTVRLSLDSGAVLLPVDRPAVAELWLWLDLERSGRPAGATYDGVEVSAIDDAGVLWPRWSSRQTPPAPRTWTPVLVDLSELAGRTVRLRVAFDTVDGRDNDHEGVYLGALRVFPPCASDRGCPAPTACAQGTVTAITPSSDSLCVSHAPEPGAPCVQCNTDDQCATSDPCDTGVCNAGRCEVTRTLTAECCTPAEAFPPPAAFEVDLGPDWRIDAPTVGAWHRSERRAHGGQGALRFGVPGAAETAPAGEAASGEVWSPPLVPPPDAPAWTFWVWLSTEFDGAPDPLNPAGLDLLEAVVAVDTGAPVSLPPAVVWDSRAIGGTSGGAWWPVSIDLGPFAGQVVRLGWRFATGDAEANDGEGAFIDDVSAVRVCPGSGDPGGRL